MSIFKVGKMAYTDEKQVLMLISLLKQHEVKYIVASPGSSNVALVASLQNDPYFEMYSCVDERSAAYLACGIAAETGRSVALSCTGATASRNYIPGLTEAFYRKLPIVAITASLNPDRVGHLHPQMMDRSSAQKDIYRKSVTIKPPHSSEDEWANNVKINEALLCLTHNGGGPAHINLVLDYSTSFTVQSIPTARCIQRFTCDNDLPAVPEGNIAIYVGSHQPWSPQLEHSVELFCEKHNAAVIVDHTSNYTGKFSAQAAIVSSQDRLESPLLEMDLLIHIGEVSGSYYNLRPKEVWRVSPDGEIRDLFRKLTKVFQMDETTFFCQQNRGANSEKYTYASTLQSEISQLHNLLEHEKERLPFSNIWCASIASSLVPPNSIIHFGILNSLRSWNYFEIDPSVECYSNTGGFGIDGCVSSLIGGSLAIPEKIHFGIVGDLAFFYDLNSLGIRHVSSNFRLILINNGRGMEFRNYSNIAYQFGDSADTYIAAGHHFGSQSDTLVSDFCTNLGYQYMFAKSKDDFLQNATEFFSPIQKNRPIVFEVFTQPEDENVALQIVNNLKSDLKSRLKQSAKGILGSEGIATAKKIIHNR